MPYERSCGHFLIFFRDERGHQLTDGDRGRESSSDSCSDESESEKLFRWDGSSSEEGVSEQENTFDGRLGNLYFQYFDQSTPYGRVPLMDKVNYLCDFVFTNLKIVFFFAMEDFFV